MALLDADQMGDDAQFALQHFGFGISDMATLFGTANDEMNRKCGVFAGFARLLSHSEVASAIKFAVKQAIDLVRKSFKLWEESPPNKLIFFNIPTGFAAFWPVGTWRASYIMEGTWTKKRGILCENGFFRTVEPEPTNDDGYFS